MTLPARKKLLVLDVNGLLVETYFKAEKKPEDRPPDGKVGSFFVYRRPYCNEFLEFCFENFEVGIWSSARWYNVEALVDFIFGDLRSKLLFSWHQNDCTDTGLKTPENKRKPVFLKELYKLWNKAKPDLPWEEGDYGPFNTLLIDDTPYKAMRNPPYTAVFPYPYKVSNDPDDILGGELRKYLEGLSSASNVQQYVEHHLFGQPPLSKESPSWDFYCQVLFMQLPMANHKASEQLLNSISQTTIPRKKLQGEQLICDDSRKSNLAIQQRSISIVGRKENGMDETLLSCMAHGNEPQNMCLQEKEVNLQSDHGQHPQSISYISKRKKKCNYHPTTSINQYSVPGLEREENGVVEAAKPSMAKSKGLIQAALSQENEAHNMSGEKEVALALLADHGKHSELGPTQNTSIYNYNKKRKFNQANRISKQSDPSMGSQGGLAETVVTNGISVATSSHKHGGHNMLPEDKEASVRTDRDHRGNNATTKSGRDFHYQNNFRPFNKGHHFKSKHFNKAYHKHSNRQFSIHFQTNSYEGRRASYFPRRQFQDNRGHENGVNANLQPEVPQGGVYSSNNGFSSTAVHANLPSNRWGGNINGGQNLWPSQQCYKWGGFQYGPENPNPNHIRSTGFHGQSCNSNYMGSVVQNPLPDTLSHEQMHTPFYDAHYEGPGHMSTGLHNAGHNSNHVGSAVGQNPFPEALSLEQMHTSFTGAHYQGPGHMHSPQPFMHSHSDGMYRRQKSNDRKFQHWNKGSTSGIKRFVSR